MSCPHCSSPRTRKYGKTVSGNQRYRCKDCGKSWTGEKVGRPPISDKPMTNLERWRRWRDRHKK